MCISAQTCVFVLTIFSIFMFLNCSLRYFTEISNTMAMEQSPYSSIHSYDQFVVVAEDNYKMFSGEVACEENDGNLHKTGTKFSVFLAGFEWECTFTSPDLITVENKDLHQENGTGEVYVEMLLCDDKFRPFSGFPMRQNLTANESVWQYPLPTNWHKFIILTIRVLKEWPYFPDFTSKVKIGHYESNGKLRVGGQVFHVNKEILSALSPYFNALFNGDFNEAKQDEIELKGLTKNEEYNEHFHDFLMAISWPSTHFPDALPNVNNVAALLALAQCYSVDSVRDKCVRHLKFCPEMPARERLDLAEKYQLKELQFHIKKEINSLAVRQELLYPALETALYDQGIFGDAGNSMRIQEI